MTAYPDFFRAVTGHPPYPYQARLAAGPVLLGYGAHFGLGAFAPVE